MNTTTNTTITPTDRLSWLAWRADWRARCAEASQDVRDHKKEIVALRSKGAHVDRVGQEQSDLHYARVEAHRLMVERTKADEARVARIAEARAALEQKAA